MRIWWLTLVIVVIAAAMASGASAPAAYTRANSGGGVDVKATYATPEYFVLIRDAEGARKYRPETQIVFLLVFDTHAGDLLPFDVVRNTRLRTSAGREYAPVRWEATSDSSHHRAGALIFAARAQGTPVITPAVSSIALEIVGLVGVPKRTLTWALPMR